MSASQRNKGAAGEREVARLLRGVYPNAMRRLAEVRGEQLGCDIEGVNPWCVQVKCAARPQLIPALMEATGATTEDAPFPVAICRQSSRGRSTRWTATLWLDQFLMLTRLLRTTTTGGQ